MTCKSNRESYMGGGILHILIIKMITLMEGGGGGNSEGWRIWPLVNRNFSHILYRQFSLLLKI